MRYSVLFRIVIYLALALSIINGWWFVALPLIIIGMWQFSFSFEIIISGIIYDALFGMVPSMGVRGYAGTIIALVIITITYVLKKIVR